MTSKDQALGGLICTTCVSIAIVYTPALFWPALEAIRLWLVAIPVFIAFIVVLGIGAWIGWTMATTPPPKPIEDIQVEEKRKDAFDSLAKLLRSSRKTILLILIAVGATIAISTTISILFSRIANLYVPSLGTIKTLGVEAYWDVNVENKTEAIHWGTIWPGSTQNVTLYVRSISNIETTLNLNATNWNPTNLSNYMNLTWNYNGATIRPNEIIQVTLTLSTPFIQYLITNDVKQFSFDIIISTKEYS